MGGTTIEKKASSVIRGLVKPTPSARVPGGEEVLVAGKVVPDFWKTTEGKPTVVLVDSFQNSTLVRNADENIREIDVSSGEISATAYEANGADVKRINSDNSKNGVSLALKSLISYIKRTGDKPKLVQISNPLPGRSDLDVNYWSIANVSTDKKVAQLKELERAKVEKAKESGFARSVPLSVTDNMATVDSIEELVKDGVPVIVDAGDAGKESVNMFSVAKGVKTVGAKANDGKPAEYSGNNRFVNEWETPFGVTKGNEGYEITDTPDDRLPITSLATTKFGISLLKK